MSLFPKFKIDEEVAKVANPAKPDPEISNFSDFSKGGELSENELKELLEDDWPDFKDNPEALKAFAQAVLARRMRERGEIPPHYTATTECKSCGRVPIFEGAPERVEGCPWCFNRLLGFLLPKINEHTMR